MNNEQLKSEMESILAEIRRKILFLIEFSCEESKFPRIRKEALDVLGNKGALKKLHELLDYFFVGAAGRKSDWFGNSKIVAGEANGQIDTRTRIE